MKIPAIKKWRAIRDIPRLARQPVTVFSGYHRELGDNFHFSVSKLRRTHMTTDADVVQHVLQRNHRNYEKSEIQADQMALYLGRGLLTNNGSSWLRQRRLIQPGFHRQRLAALVKEMNAVIQQRCDFLDGKLAREEPVDLYSFTQQAAFQIISRAIFTDSFDEAETQRLNQLMDDIQGYMIYPIRMPFLRKPLRWLGQERKHLALSQQVRDQLLEIINQRRESGTVKDDLLQMLIESRYEDDGSPMTDEQLIDEIIILFAAGYETSANALSWIFYLLTQHPEVLDKVRQEIETVKRKGPIDFDSVRELKYLTQVIEESMRLYPPAWITDRVALADDAVKDMKIEQGTVVGIFIYGVHHSERYYESPEEFRPDRMSPEAKKDRHPFAFLPFGGGPRLCIGNHFAMLEMQLLLSSVLDRYDFTLVSGQEQPGLRPIITLHMDRRVRIRINHRLKSQSVDA
ncbi:cytochrome P450 [Lewinella sp. W8]|uniref:cytochrome P450 n=1 Tax=Lewinella sp. W8 TaxID=2528208 RepID=UPI001563B6E5|nr:cytochrome P450 [Lewinella sp. W8]